ncbi:MAG TPA: tetratricopeptide repeat protein [Gillisia sp.]|nr:tetratricopeptide repeat protein [Gillisia sp.]
MKIKLFTIALSLFSVVAIAQKKEIRDAGKAIEKGSYAEAKSLLTQAEANLASANDKMKADYYLIKGHAFLGTGENTSVQDLMTAAEAYKQAQQLGDAEAANGLSAVSNAIVQSAVKDQNTENFSGAADKLYAGYKINPQDTLYLYYAASNAINAKDYDKALVYYEELRDLGYDGSEIEYIAVNKTTGEEESMNKAQRDLMVKAGEYIKPEDRKSPPKKGEIMKNIALIHIANGNEDKAVAAMEAAKVANPDDLSLLQSEADMYYRMGKKDKYKEIMEGIVKKDPNNATLYYNLGVTSFEIGDNQTAIDYYKKALAINPDLNDARLNIAAAVLAKEAAIVEEMNALGMSKADTKKYDELSEQRKVIYREALPYLETVMEKDPNNKEAMRTTMNIYYQLGDNAKAEAIQAKLDASNQE